MSCVISDKRPEQADVMCLCDSEESGLAGESDSVRGEGVCCTSERDDLVAESEGDDTVNNDSSDVATGSEGLEGDKFDTEIGRSLEGEWQGQQVVAPWPTENISGRLRKCLGVWRDIGASRWVQDLLYFGYKLPFIQLPKPAVFENHTACDKHRSYVDKAIAELVDCGAAQKVENEAAHVISPLGVVEARKLRLRPDLRFVNKHLAKYRFHCDGLDCFTEMYKKGD